MNEAASDLEEEAELEVDDAAAARADEQALRLPSERSRREGALRSLASSVGRAGRGMRQSPLIQTTVIGAVALMLVLCGLVRLLVDNGGALVNALGRDVAMIVYLNDDVSPARAAQIGEALRKLPGVSTVHRVTRAEAQERLRHSLGDRSDFLEGTEESLIPLSIEVGFRNGVSDILRVHPLYDRLRSTEGVQDVELMGDWVRRLLKARQLLEGLGWLLGGLCAAAGLAVVCGTIRLGIYARRDELAVLRLVGATDLHIALPLLVEGLLQGLLGAGIALGLLYGLWRLVVPTAVGLLQEMLGEVPLRFLTVDEILIGLLLAAAAGLLGSRLALRRFLRE